jgi:hypothetical protein
VEDGAHRDKRGDEIPLPALVPAIVMHAFQRNGDEVEATGAFVFGRIG